MKFLVHFTFAMFLMYSCSTTESLVQQDSVSSTLPEWYSTDSYQSDSASIHYFLSFQSEDSLAAAKHGYKVAQIAFLNTIDDKVELVRMQQEDDSIWDSPAIIQALRSSTYLLMDLMVPKYETVLKKQGSDYYEYYLQISVPKEKIIKELKKSTDNHLGSEVPFWVELSESF
jgi:hypothetical protein